MISRPFIERPRLAIVISIVITLAGLIALFNIPVAQYPEITPPEVVIFARYPGANASTVAESVAAPIEEEINGVERMLYMSSTCTNDGSYNLFVTFEVGTNPDIAQVNVQNRLQLAMNKLPREVVDQGITVRKRTTDILAVVSFYSPKGTYDRLFLSNYVNQNVREALLRINGVSDIFIFGELKYSMRIWLYPDRLASLQLGVEDVVEALKDQNIQAAIGSVGSSPTITGQQVLYTLQAKGRLRTPEEFYQIIIRKNDHGGVIRLADIARVELGAQSYGNHSFYNGAPNIGFAIYRAPDANAVQTMEDVVKTLAELKDRFPSDVEYAIVYDTTKYVKGAIEEIQFTLIFTFLLVVFVTYLFLQNWRATLIPTIAIPVSLIGTFAVLLGLGYSANTISLFALVLAIGLVVDDAIVVVENTWRLMEEEALSAKDAAIKGMGQVTGPVIATTLVLLAVFVPIAFMPGMSGMLYREFAVTLCTAVLISTVNALTLSPALCGVLLKKGMGPPKRGPFFWFNKALFASRRLYVSSVRWMIRRLVVPVFILILVSGSAYLLFKRTPSSFLPQEDQGNFFINIQLPESATVERTVNIVKEVSQRVKGLEGVDGVIGIAGFSLLGGTGENNGFCIVILRPWEERKGPDLRVDAIIGKVQAIVAAIPAARINAFPPPPIRGFGRTGGFDLRLLGLKGQDPAEMAMVARALIIAANQDRKLSRVFTTFSAETPQVYVEVDREKAKLMGVPISKIFSTLQTYLGSSYVNDFNLEGRTYQVKLQAVEDYRASPEDIKKLYVKGENDQMVPLEGLVELKSILGAPALYRYNQFNSVQINGEAAPGYSSGEAMEAMEALAKKVLPEGYALDWSSISFQERRVGGEVAILFALALIFGYLFLVAQYESFTIPFPIMLSVSVAALGGLVGIWVAELDLSIYAQMGLVLLVGLASKNAILIVEFSKTMREDGADLMDSALEGARVRFRPVLMTAFTFIVGVLPMVIATGAGASSRRHIGTAVFAGMLAAATLGIFLIPPFFYIFQNLRERFHLWRKTKRFVPTSLLIIGLVLLCGCSTGLIPQREPKVDLPESWKGIDPSKVSQQEALPKELGTWWKTLGDPILEQLTKLAVDQNLDLKLAHARVREAKAQREIAFANLFPSLGSSAQVAQSRSSEGTGKALRVHSYSLGIDSSWELDLFGGIRSSLKAAEEDLLAQEEALKDTLVSLLAEVGLAYIDLRTYELRLAVARKNIEIQEETYKLNLSRNQAGLIDDLVLQQSLYNLENTKAQVPVLQAGIENSKNRLSLLLGRRPGELEDLLKASSQIPIPPQRVLIGIPADTVRNRPDIRKAERNVAAQAARVGVAKAELYPSFRLSGSLGLEALHSGDLFQWAKRIWSLVTNLSYKIFKGGAIRQNVEAQKARLDQALISYEKTVLTALQEVENALVSYSKEQDRFESLSQATEAARKAYQLSMNKYNAGLVDFINVLDAQRSLHTYEDQLAQSKGALISNLIRLYKALGGGWEAL